MSAIIRNETRRSGAADVLPPHLMALIRERQRRLAALQRYDRYIARAAGHLTLQGFWRNLKRQDEDDIQRLKNWFDHEVTQDGGCSTGHTRDRAEDPGTEEA
jgi:hypothetical protein